MSAIRFGANCWIWDSPVTTDVIARRAPAVREMGFNVLEIPLENPADWDPARVKTILADAGLGASVCAAMGPGRDLTMDDAATVSSTTDYLRACIDAAATIGAGIVAGPLYSPTGQTGPLSDTDRQRALERLATNLWPIADHAASAGIQLGIEPLNRFETSLFNTVDQIMPLLETLDHPAIGLLLDTFHMNIEERSLGRAIRTGGSRVFHIHACGNDRGAPGHDGIDWTGVRDALRDIDYRGDITIESFTGANQTIATAASIWRPLAPTQDAIATDGLRFLQELFAT